MIKCPNADCGYENVDGTQFCEGCGEELPQNGAATASSAASGATAGGSMITCPACDNLNPADNAVCEVCGSDLHPPANTKAAAVSTPDPTLDPVSPSITDPQDAAGAGIGSSNTAPMASGTSAPPVSQMPSADSAVPGGTSPASTTGGVVPMVAPDVVAGDSATGDSAPGQVVASMPNVTPIDTTSGQDTGAAPSLGSATADPAVAQNADPQIPGASIVTATGTAASGLEVGKVKFTVEQGMSVGKQFVLGDSEMLVGREDADESIYPDIDLSDQDEGFVHRRHAQLKFENGGLSVTHLGGANKTRINNRPLPDNEAQPVQIGDKVAFGKVVMRVGAV